MGQPDGLVAWLGAQVDADEQGAHRWRKRKPGAPPHRVTGPVQGDYVEVQADGFPAHLMTREEYREEFTVPAEPDRRLLAEVAAKRAILDLHARRLHTHTFHQVGQVTGPVELWTCATCCDDRCPTWEELGAGHRDPSLISCCQTIPLLALPYADRDGYNEAWRP